MSDAVTDRNRHTDDPMEKIMAAALDFSGLPYVMPTEERTLDFYLTESQIFIEVKQFHAPRIADQMARHPDVIAVQGRRAVEWLASLLRRLPAAHWLASGEMTMSDAADDEMVKSALKTFREAPTDMEGMRAVLLSHAARQTAPATGDREELVDFLNAAADEHQSTMFKLCARMLEADARREAALADEAVREIEDLFTRPVTYGGRPWPDGEWLQEHLLAGVLAILAKVSAGRPDSGAGSSLEDWVRDVAAGRPDGGER